MSEATKAVFLSYASQDAEAARRICEALRAAEVEVWFDQNELVGGDAWDAKIRGQIASCALFVPIISAATQARREGYFRLEWKLADERTHLMAEGTPFLLPVVIDATKDREALVPKSFLVVQWTRAPGGETTAAFCSRVNELLGGSSAATELPRAIPSAERRDSSEKISSDAPAPVAVRARRRPGPLIWAALAVLTLGVGGFYGYRTYIASQVIAIPKPLGRPEPVKKESRVLVARFENRTGDPALDLVGQLVAERVRELLPEIDWVKEVAALPAVQKVSVELTAGEMGRLARETGADTFISGAYHRQGDQVLLRGRVFDLSRGKSWAELAPIAGPAADASAAIEEQAQRLAGIATYLGWDRQGRTNYAVMLNFAVPQRLDSLRLRWNPTISFSSASSEQREAGFRRSYEVDPKGGAGSLVQFAIERTGQNDFSKTEELVREIDALPPERLMRFDRERVAWMRAVVGGNLQAMAATALKLRAWWPDDPFWIQQVMYANSVMLKPRAMLAEFADVTPGDSRETIQQVWQVRMIAYFILADYAAVVQAAERLLALAPQSHEALQYRLLAQLGLGDYAAAIRTLDESHGFPRVRGRFFYPGFHYLAAIAQMRHLGRGESSEFGTLVRHAEAWFAARPPQESHTAAQRFDRARVWYLAGRYAEARAESEALARESPADLAYRGFVGTCAARLGDKTTAHAAVAWLRDANPKYRAGYVAYLQARIAALLGERGDALRLLREAKAQYSAPVAGFHLAVDFLLDPDFEELASDPEFKAIVTPKG